MSKKLQIKGMLPDMYNGAIFFLRIILAFIFVILITFLLNIESKYIILISGITGTAISFASMKAINNFVAGVWISLTRPFNVGDYVELGGKEGIIIEIALNYTKIKHRDGNVTLIPNLSCLKSELINYSISTKWFSNRIKGLKKIVRILKQRKINDVKNKKYLEYKHLEEKLERLMKDYEEIQLILKQIEERGFKKYKKHSKYASDDRIVRYTFNLAFEKNPKKINERLDEVCDKWTEEFEIKPKFRLLGIDSHLRYNFIILTPDPMDIIKYIGEFFEDIYTIVCKI